MIKATSRKSFSSDMTHSVKDVLFRSCDRRLALINIIKKYKLTNKNFVARLAMFLQSLKYSPTAKHTKKEKLIHTPQREIYISGESTQYIIKSWNKTTDEGKRGKSVQVDV